MLLLWPQLGWAQSTNSGPAAPAPADKIEPLHTSITVTEQVSTETPAAVSVIESKALAETPGVNLDDRLRSVPGFSLFRRSSSIVAHPTTQGVSLRGIGSSGTSRTLVLLDGIPVNDPFGGWVYWTQFAPQELERVEVLRGASTSVFGDRAMGGAIALFTRPPERLHLDAGYEAGNHNTHDLCAGFSDLVGPWGISGRWRGFTTDGYFIVPEPLRGRVDRRASAVFTAGEARIDYLGAERRVFVKVNVLGEERENGTALQSNSTGLGTLAAHYEADTGSDVFSITGFHTREDFHSSFSAIAANRNSETLTYRQTVPAEGLGGAGLWSHAASGWDLLAGADVFRVEGTSTDSLVPSGKRIGGGTQLQHGVFAQGDTILGTLKLFGGLRHQFTGQGGTFLSPSGGFVLGRKRFRARGSVYRSFRAPTLNELFREFRQGNVDTLPNPALRPEVLFGSEVGVDYVGESSRLRLTFYRNSMTDLIANVTLTSSPNLIIRQRQNTQASLSRGVEVDAAQRWGHWRGELGYLMADSRVSTGPRVPQIPRHQGSGMVAYERGGTLATLGVRSFSFQFEDDVNRFVLPGYATVQLVVRRRLTGSLSALAEMENLLDREYIAGISPAPIIGAPRLWRIGLRWDGQLHR